MRHAALFLFVLSAMFSVDLFMADDVAWRGWAMGTLGWFNALACERGKL